MSNSVNAPFGREDFFVKACFGSEGPAGPAGKDGQTPTVSVGKVETLAAGQSAEVVNSGTDKAAVFDFKIPKGQDGQNTKLMAPHYDSYEQLAAQHPAGTCGEAYLVGELNFIYVWDLNTNSWVSVGKLGYLPETFTEFRADILEELGARYTKNETDGLISAHNLSPESHADIRQALETLQLVTWVDALPETGESKYIYAVPREETDTEGKQIAALYFWDGSAWRGAGAFSLNIAPDTLATKTELSEYLPKTGGNIVGTLAIAREKGLIDTLMPEVGSGSGYTRLRVYSYNGHWVGYLFHNAAGDASIMLVDGGHLNISVSDNREVRIEGKRILTIGDKGVSGGVASLGSDGKVPQEQLPNVSAATPVTALGQISTASLQTNNNYTASVSGGASITLPTPADTTIANKITVNLTVLSAANIDWGVNANAALAQFEPGKYQIRLLWNNTSSEWSAEVLKETKAESNVKTFISFNDNYSDECGTVSLTLNSSPSYSPGPFENHKSLAVDRSDSPLTMSGDLTKWNFGLNPFKITCWVLNSNNVYFDIFSSSDNSTKVNTMGQCTAKGVSLSPTTTSINISAWTFLEFGRGSDGIFRFFADGVQKMQKDASTIEADFSNAGRMFSNYGSASTAYMSDFVISAESVSQADYTRPTMPFVLADNGVSDLHDIKIAELYSSISALQNELQILKGQSMKRLDYTNAVEFYLKEEDQTSYTVPANGYIFGYGYQTYKTVGESYTGNILINGMNVGKYFRKYTLNNDQVDTSIPLSMPLPVSAGDVITITGNREAFQEPYLFVPEKED